MTPEERAKELINKFKSNLRADNRSWEVEYKQCALICVDEIIKTHIHKNIIGLGDYHSGRVIEYWQEVKEEIEKL